MKIKIIKSDSKFSWYKNRIGEVFEIIRESKTFDGEKMYIVGEGRVTNSFILKQDCIITEP